MIHSHRGDTEQQLKHKEDRRGPRVCVERRGGCSDCSHVTKVQLPHCTWLHFSSWNVTEVGLPFLESVPDMCNSCQKRLTRNRPHTRRARLSDLPGLEAASAAMSEIWILSSCAELSNSVPEWYPTHQYFSTPFPGASKVYPKLKTRACDWLGWGFQD